MKTIVIPCVAALGVVPACGTSPESSGNGDASSSVPDAGKPEAGAVGEPDAGTGDSRTPIDRVEETIGPEGGRLALPGDEAVLVVPPEALEDTLTLWMERKDRSAFPTPSRLAGPVVALGPSDTPFALPVRLELNSPEPPPETFRKSVLRLDEPTMRWLEVEGATFDGTRALADLSSLSTYGAGFVAVEGGGPLGPGDLDCTRSADCMSGLVCAPELGVQFDAPDRSVCVPAHCTDGRRTGEEVGVDCGQSSGCGHCFARTNPIDGEILQVRFSLSAGTSPLVSSAADEVGGAFLLHQGGHLVRTDGDGAVLTEGPLENATPPYLKMTLDKENNLLTLSERWLQKRAPDGSILWSYGGHSGLELTDVSVDCQNRVLLVGQYFGAPRVEGVEFTSSETGLDGFLIKLEPDGSVRLARPFPGIVLDRVYSMAYAGGEDCTYYVTGRALTIRANFTDDPADELTAIRPSRNRFNWPFAKFDKNDQHVWSRMFFGSGFLADATFFGLDPRGGAGTGAEELWLAGNNSLRLLNDTFIDSANWHARFAFADGRILFDTRWPGNRWILRFTRPLHAGPITVLGWGAGLLQFGGFDTLDLPSEDPETGERVRAYYVTKLGSTIDEQGIIRWVNVFLGSVVLDADVLLTSTGFGRLMLAGSLNADAGEFLILPEGAEPRRLRAEGQGWRHYLVVMNQ